MKRDLIFAGVGGQGIVLASKLVSRTALRQGSFVRTAETIGMAQRGGSVVSHVRIGEEVASPLVPLARADALVGFEPGEAVRCLAYLRPGGTVVVSDRTVAPVTAALSRSDYDGRVMLDHLRLHTGRLVVVDARSVCEAAGSPKVLNCALLGAASAAGVLKMSLEELEETIHATLAERFVEMNVNALRAGARYAEETM